MEGRDSRADLKKGDRPKRFFKESIKMYFTQIVEMHDIIHLAFDNCSRNRLFVIEDLLTNLLFSF